MKIIKRTTLLSVFMLTGCFNGDPAKKTLSEKDNYTFEIDSFNPSSSTKLPSFELTENDTIKISFGDKGHVLPESKSREFTLVEAANIEIPPQPKLDVPQGYTGKLEKREDKLILILTPILKSSHLDPSISVNPSSSNDFIVGGFSQSSMNTMHQLMKVDFSSFASTKLLSLQGTRLHHHHKSKGMLLHSHGLFAGILKERAYKKNLYSAFLGNAWNTGSLSSLIWGGATFSKNRSLLSQKTYQVGVGAHYTITKSLRIKAHYIQLLHTQQHYSIGSQVEIGPENKHLILKSIRTPFNYYLGVSFKYGL